MEEVKLKFQRLTPVIPEEREGEVMPADPKVGCCPQA